MLEEVSEAERSLVLAGVAADLRADGRRRMQLRPTVIESGLMGRVAGSAMVRSEDTEVVAVVRTNLESKPGLLFNVDFSANVENRETDKMALRMAVMLKEAYKDIFELDQLQVVQGEKAWVICVDAQIMAWGDSAHVTDLVSMAVKAALVNTRLPKVRGQQEDGGIIELQLPQDPFDSIPLKASEAPVFVTLSKLGNFLVADASLVEYACSSASVVLSVTAHSRVTMAKLEGGGSFHLNTLQKAIKEAVDVASDINKALKVKLEEEANPEEDGTMDSSMFF